MDLKEQVKKAGEIIKGGGLVAFPTETVYGLGGDAFNPSAVTWIYESKGRPPDNPLILHISDIDTFKKIAKAPPKYAVALIKKFWPGPLTLVVEKNPDIPLWVGTHPDNETATVGIRMPAHPIAKALISMAGCAIVAPSANKAGTPSPTSAEHVLDDFTTAYKAGSGDRGFIMVLDGGSVDVGIESTVVDVTGKTPKILRPGAITAEMISETAKLPVEGGTGITGITGIDESQDQPRSPGMKYRHYAPEAPMTIVSGESKNVAEYILNECRKQHSEGQIGVLVTMEIKKYFIPRIPPNAQIITLGEAPEDMARNLFACLRQFDKINISAIFAEAVQDPGVGVAIMDRMLKAAEGRIVYV